MVRPDVGYDPPSVHDWLPEGYLGARVLKDGTRCHRGLVSTLRALQQYDPDGPIFPGLTARTAEIVRPPKSAQILATRLFGGKTGLKLTQVSRVVFHPPTLHIGAT